MAIELQSNGSGDELETLNELIRNITQLTAKSNGKPMENKKQPSHHPHPPTATTMVTSTTRVIADETDKVGTTSTERISTDTDRSRSSTEGVGPDVFLGSSSTATPSHLAQVFTITAPTPLLTRHRTGALDPHKSVHTEVDKDNKKIEVVYAETVTTTPITGDDNDQKTTLLNGNRGAFQEDKVTSIQPSTPTTLLFNTTTTAAGDDGLKGDDSDEGDATPTPPEATTPLLPTAKIHEDSHPHPRRPQQQLLLLRKHLQQRNSLLTVLNATEIGTIGSTSSDNVTIKAGDESELSSISQKELARVADALKALRNLAGICNNKGNTSSSGGGGVLGNKCLNRTKTAAPSAFALDRRNRVENVLARTHEEVAARTKAASSRRKLRVCGHLILKRWMDDQDTRQQ